MTRAEFISELSRGLTNLGSAEKTEILEDFGRHFIDGEDGGLSEEEICEKLGDPREIAKQYAGAEVNPNASNAPNLPNAQVFTPNYQNRETLKENYFHGGGLIGIICLDIFFFSWALPTLLSLVISYWAVVVSFVVSGFACVIASFGFPFFQTPMPLVSAFFAGIALISLGGLSALLGITISKGFAGVIKGVGALHVDWVYPNRRKAASV